MKIILEYCCVVLKQAFSLSLYKDELFIFCLLHKETNLFCGDFEEKVENVGGGTLGKRLAGCKAGIVDVGGGGGGATFFRFFLKSSPKPCLFFSSPMTLIDGEPRSKSFDVVERTRGDWVGITAILIGRRLLRGGVAGAWEREVRLNKR